MPAVMSCPAILILKLRGTGANSLPLQFLCGRTFLSIRKNNGTEERAAAGYADTIFSSLTV